jgi:hypothetical protein
MITKETLLDMADLFRGACGIERETTLSSRIFDDSKRLTNLRGDGDITISSFTKAMTYMAANWPQGQSMPDLLVPYVPRTEDAA